MLMRVGSHVLALSHVRSHKCFHICALIFNSHTRAVAFVCAPVCSRTHMSHVCSHVFALICVFSYPCSRMCSLMRVLLYVGSPSGAPTCAQTCVLICALMCVFVCSHSRFHMCVLTGAFTLVFTHAHVFICFHVFVHVRALPFEMCALIYVCSHICAVLPMLSCVCLHMCVVTCVCVCFHVCALQKGASTASPGAWQELRTDCDQAKAEGREKALPQPRPAQSE